MLIVPRGQRLKYWNDLLEHVLGAVLIGFGLLVDEELGIVLGSSSKKSTFSGISVSTSVRCWRSAAMAAASYAGFFTLRRIYGSAALAKASGLIARIYSLLK